MFQKLYGIVIRAPDSGPRGSSRFETRARRIFHYLGKVSVLDDGAGRRKGALAVYTLPGRASVIRNVAYATYVPHSETVLVRLACRQGIRSPKEQCEQCRIDKFRYW
jgi:hypothetical protein